AQARAAMLGHLLAGHADEAMNPYVVRHLVGGTCELQHRRPEERVEVDDVLAYEVDLLGAGRAQELLEAARLAPLAGLAGVEVILERGEITNRRIEPHVEILARRVRDRDAEVGGIARYVPVRERLLAGPAQPLSRLVDD